MTPKVQVGTILIAQVLGLESEPYSGSWSVIKGLDGFSLDRKIHTAGWNFFFITTEVKVMIFGAIGATNIHSALKRILEKMRPVKLQLFRSHRDSRKARAGWPPRSADGAKREARGLSTAGTDSQ